MEGIHNPLVGERGALTGSRAIGIDRRSAAESGAVPTLPVSCRALMSAIGPSRPSRASAVLSSRRRRTRRDAPLSERIGGHSLCAHALLQRINWELADKARLNQRGLLMTDEHWRYRAAGQAVAAV